MLSLDPTTRAEYDAAETPSARAAVVLAAITGTVTATVYDGSDVARGTGTMQTPWASIAGSRLVIGELADFLVTSGGTPDADWYLAFESGGRWLRGPFGLTADAWADFKWSLPAFSTGQSGRLGTVEVQAQGYEPVEAAPFDVSWSIDETVTVAYSVSWSVLFEPAPVPGGYDGMVANNETLFPINLARGTSFDLASYVTGGTPPYTFTIEKGELPTGATQQSGGGHTGNLIVAASGADLGQAFPSPTELDFDTRDVSNDIWFTVTDASL